MSSSVGRSQVSQIQCRRDLSREQIPEVWLTGTSAQGLGMRWCISVLLVLEQTTTNLVASNSTHLLSYSPRSQTCKIDLSKESPSSSVRM